MEKRNRRLTVAIIRKQSMRALINAGVSETQANMQLDMLLDAELREVYSHGLLRLPRVIARIANGVCNAQTVGHGVWKKAAFYALDGEHGLGPVVAMHAIDEICARVQDTGVAIAAVRNCEHLGMLAWYAEQVASRGKILIALTVSEALVHPWGGKKAMLGTNPIAIGIPAKPEPFVLDMATSCVSMGKIHDYANRHQAIPEGWAVDTEGEPTTDALAAKQGAIAPFGGAKGYGLGLGFELLVTSLAGSAIGTDVVGTLDDDAQCNKGDVFIVIEPQTTSGELINRYLQALRGSPAADSNYPVRVPGDHGRKIRQQRETQSIEVDAGVWARIEQLAEA